MDEKIRELSKAKKNKKKNYKELMHRDKKLFKLSKKKNSIKDKKFGFIDEENEIIRKQKFALNREFLSKNLNSCPKEGNYLYFYFN